MSNATEKIREKKAICEIITDILENQIEWRRKNALETYEYNRETEEYAYREKARDELSEEDYAILRAIDTIEAALIKLV